MNAATGLGFLLVCLATSVPAATPASGLDVIRAYEGAWKTDIENLASPYSKASKDTSALRNNCWRSEGYFACNQIVNGESKALIVFTYDAKKDEYTTYPIPPDGGEPHSGRLLIKGNVWVLPWEITEKGKTIHFRVVNTFTAANRIEYRQEYSADQAHWTVIGRGVETRAD
jgi:hypothetical protein